MAVSSLLSPPPLSSLFSAADRSLLTPALLCRIPSPLLIDLVWERLNSGHWASVPDAWRRLYSLLRLHAVADALPASPDLLSLLRCLSLLDDGLTMGSPLPGNQLALLAAALHAQAMAATPGNVLDGLAAREAAWAMRASSPGAAGDGRLSPVAMVSSPSVLEFAEAVREGRPLLLDGCLGHWAALERWSMTEMCRRAGYRTVPVEMGSSYADDEWSQERMRLIDFVREFVFAEGTVDRPRGYLAQHQLFNQIPDLLDDVPPPDYCYCVGKGRVDANVWLGPQGTVSPLHTDPRPNLLAQVVGEKYVQLFLPEETPRLYPHPGSMLSNTSQVDAENPDSERFPEFKKARGLYCVLKPGQMLFIPPKCWHYVRSLTPSISVNFWFD